MTSLLGRIAEQFSVTPKGVLHVGANKGQEADDYDKSGLKNVIWIEGNPEVFPNLMKTLSSFPYQRGFLCLASDRDNDEVEFHVMSNESGSSSIYEPNMVIFNKYWPGIERTKTMRLYTRRLDTFFMENGVDLSPYNIINIDIQGHELYAIRGLGEALRIFDIICAEVHIGGSYHGCTLLHELDAYLLSNGFSRAYLTVGNVDGEAWYVRREPSMLHYLTTVYGAKVIEWSCKMGILGLLKKTKRLRAFVKHIFPRGICNP